MTHDLGQGRCCDSLPAMKTAGPHDGNTIKPFFPNVP